MELLNINTDSATLRITLDELLIIHQILNEACNGIDIRNFTQKIGADEEYVEKLMLPIRRSINEIDKMQKVDTMDQYTADIAFSSNELLILHNVLGEVCKEIDLIEFSTRVGAEQKEVKDLMDTLASVNLKIKRNPTDC